MSSLRSVTDDLKRPLAENEVWTLLNMSLESLSASYRGEKILCLLYKYNYVFVLLLCMYADFRPSRHLNKSSIGPFLIISVEGLLLRKNSVQFNSGLQSSCSIFQSVNVYLVCMVLQVKQLLMSQPLSSSKKMAVSIAWRPYKRYLYCVVAREINELLFYFLDSYFQPWDCIEDGNED